MRTRMIGKYVKKELPKIGTTFIVPMNLTNSVLGEEESVILARKRKLKQRGAQSRAKIKAA